LHLALSGQHSQTLEAVGADSAQWSASVGLPTAW
jgi:hypothetical protein